MRRSGYLPGLDGLRALAILGVLMTHDQSWTIFGHSNAGWKGLGGWGVYLFFAISGILICWRLLEDEQKLGRIHLRSFYIRRFFRIQPASWFYLVIVALLFITGALPVNWHYWLSALLSYANFVMIPVDPHAASAFLGHFWTLSVEEHFYIIISLFLVTVPKYRVRVLGAALVFLVIAQRVLAAHHRYNPDLSPRRTYWVVEFLVAPALLALLCRQERVQGFAKRYWTPAVAGLTIFGVVCLRLLKHYVLDAPAGAWKHTALLGLVVFNTEILLYACGPFIIAVMFHPECLTTRFLELAPLRFVGRLSYSIYLWHLLFFGPAILRDQGGVPSHVLNLLSERPFKYAATIAVALMSYYWVEKPSIRLGHRLAPPATEGHPDLATESRDAPRLRELVAKQ